LLTICSVRLSAPVLGPGGFAVSHFSGTLGHNLTIFQIDLVSFEYAQLPIQTTDLTRGSGFQ